MRFPRVWAVGLVFAATSVGFSAEPAPDKPAERRVRDYFPLGSGWAYSYRDSVGRTSYTLIKPYQRDGLNGYYLQDYGSDKKESPFFLVNGLGTGFYFMQDEDLYTVPTAGKTRLNSVSRAQAVRLLTSPIRDRALVRLRWAGTSRVYAVTTGEKVVVPAGTFDDCVKISRMSAFKDTFGRPAVTEHVVWLARGVGVVKTWRDDDYTTELVEYVAPKK